MSGEWMNGSAHPGEEIQDVLDGRAQPDLADRVRVHVDSCPACADLWRRLEGARRVIGALRIEESMPSDLRASVLEALDAEDRATADATPRQVPHHDAQSASTRSHVWRWWMAGAAAALVAVAVYLARPTSASLPAQVAGDYVALLDEASLTLELRTTSATEIDAFFAASPDATRVPRVRVIDLGMMGFTLDGARRHQLGGRPSALYAYRGRNDERIVCQMFEGRLDTLPPTADVRENGGFRFHVYREGDVSLVFWQEGDIICVLAARMPVDELVQLAFAKAMQPA